MKYYMDYYKRQVEIESSVINRGLKEWTDIDSISFNQICMIKMLDALAKEIDQIKKDKFVNVK